MKRLNFVDFFCDVHGHEPFPWQERLATQLIEDHAWPDLIDLPTASGKTACLDIALFHLAWCAERGKPWLAPRRIVFVVDRRIIVDSTAKRAQKLCAALESPKTAAVRRVAAALKGLGGAHPLTHEKLRGGMPRERSFQFGPAQPMIITSTVDQIGSRLLFRGYGMSPYAYPIHAGLLGHDSLLLLDEAHLSAPFMETVSAIRARQSQAERPLSSVQPVKLVPLSATANTKGIPFKLDRDDLANKELTARRTAKKPARLVEAPMRTPDRVKALLRETLDLYRCSRTPAPAVAVIVNRVRTARALYQHLWAEKKDGGFDLELMIGRSRPLDRDAVATRVVERAAAGTANKVHDRGLIVVATQTIEVGADLDFQGLVTECAAMDALRQRFGRLDRLGEFRKAQAVIVGSCDEAGGDPVYGEALNYTWSWLNTVASEVAGVPTVDFSIASMQRLTKAVDMTAMNSPLRDRLLLTPAHVDLLSQTSPRPMFEPDVHALLHGLESGLADVQVIWRAELPVTGDEPVLDASELGVATSLLTLNPPTSLESLSLPLRDVRAWLLGRADETGLADVEGVSEGEAANEAVAKPRLVLRRSAERWEHAFAGEIRPGDTLAVPSTYGGCDQFGFAPDYNKAVIDLSADARRALKKSDLVVITERWLEAIGVGSERRDSIWTALQEQRSDQSSAGELLAFLLEQISDLVAPDAWLRRKPVIDVVVSANGKLHALVVAEASVKPNDASDEDFSSSNTVPVLLKEHSSGVAAHARKLAEALCLGEEHVEHLACAGEFHDVGKADPRTQQRLRAGDVGIFPGQLLAKGSRRSRLEPSESMERHEAYSAALLRLYPELMKEVADPDLVVYLGGTHHGRGRALMPDRNDEGTAFTIELAGQTYSFEGAPGLGSLGSGWAALFWRMNRRYGPWGIAYLESILRLADWMRSAEEIEMSQSR
ncbi:type I-G CRISPR-associated helicase/endonuclease Cas3g [Steroidobacter cummioxidans]|uniref:type I-G CRISPR-associated helicase/endonuclease Cas3g n=1 Tax=Steroidobacter cummioxidans TaxID=1803913 RepID=UPI000E30D801|nr:type I-U CRISPR-associated helicase/endonuclease Cas3 [Steroidobacter cummioxidans]